MLAIPRVSVRMIGRSGPIFASSNFSRARLHKAMQGSVQEGKRWQSQLCTFFQMGKCFLENRSTYHLHNRRVSPSHIFGLHWFANNKYGKSVKYHLVQCVQLTWCEHEGKWMKSQYFWEICKVKYESHVITPKGTFAYIPSCHFFVFILVLA